MWFDTVMSARTIFQGRDAFERDAKVIGIQEARGVVEELDVLEGGRGERRADDGRHGRTRMVTMDIGCEGGGGRGRWKEQRARRGGGAVQSMGGTVSQRRVVSRGITRDGPGSDPSRLEVTQRSRRL